MSDSSNRLNWYIVQQADGTCAVVNYADQEPTPETSSANHWGAFATEQEAIAKKIGLIRAGKCKPQ